MNYIYNNFKFNTDLELYKILPSDINSPYVKDFHGTCIIYFPSEINASPRPTTPFQQIYLTIGSYKYRLKSIDPVSLTIIQINDLKDTLIDYDCYSVRILSDHITEELIKESLLDSGLFEVVTQVKCEFKYTELINFLVNKSVNISELALRHTPINLIDTKDRYSLDFTHCMYALYDRLKIDLEKQKFHFKNLYETIETDTREVATLQFNNYPEDYFRLFPNWDNEFQKVPIQVRLQLNTSSVSKFERLLQEYKSLKYLSNIPRIYLEDMFHKIWVCNIKWNPDVETNSPSSAENDRNEQSYYIGINLEYNICLVRNTSYAAIRQILLNIKAKRGHSFNPKSL